MVKQMLRYVPFAMNYQAKIKSHEAYAASILCARKVYNVDNVRFIVSLPLPVPQGEAWKEILRKHNPNVVITDTCVEFLV